VIDQPSADEGPDQKPSKRGQPRPDADARSPIRHTQGAVEQREATGDDQGGTHALEDARRDEDYERWGDGTCNRRHKHDHEPNHQHPSPAVAVSECSGDEQQSRRREEVARQSPLKSHETGS
jgi:hypothetical protein